MPDTWDGAATSVGVLTAQFNTDSTAIRFSRSDGEAFSDDTPLVICNTLAQGFKAAAEQTERLAASIEQIDQAFADVCRAQAKEYRDAVATPAPAAAAAKKR